MTLLSVSVNKSNAVAIQNVEIGQVPVDKYG